MEKIIQRWYEMIRINSINGHEVNLADYIAKELRSMNLEPHYSYFPEDAEEMVRPSVWTSLDSGKPGKTMMLIGHIDTVGVASGWKTEPFVPTEVDGKVHGLGAMDMKGGLAAILETLEYYSLHKDEFTGIIEACFVADEESLSKGTYQLVDEGITADMAIMAECRYDNIAIGFRGRYVFEVTVKGKAAHTSKYPAVGENALISAARLVIAIENLPTAEHPKLKSGTWVVRHVTGGDKGTLVVPELCEIQVDRFVVPGENERSCIDQILEAAQSLGLEDKVKVRLKPRNSPYMQSFSLDPSNPLVTVVRDKFKAVTGEELRIEYDPSVCDSNILAVSLGIPTVTFGPSGGGMHAANEYGHAYQVKNAAEVYRLAIAELLR